MVKSRDKRADAATNPEMRATPLPSAYIHRRHDAACPTHPNLIMSITNTTLPADETYIAPATRLRQLISQEGVCVQAPGVYDGICARVAIESGFKVMVSMAMAELMSVPIWSHDDRGPSWQGRPCLRLVE
jgi:hypothetical protein